jgi:hypothetical protein
MSHTALTSCFEAYAAVNMQRCRDVEGDAHMLYAHFVGVTVRQQ